MRLQKDLVPIISSLHTKLIAKPDLIAKLDRAGTKQIPFNFIRSLHFFHPIVSVASSISLLFYLLTQGQQ